MSVKTSAACPVNPIVLWTILAGSTLSSTMVASADDRQLAQINQPLLSISSDNRSFGPYFEAWKLLDSTDPRTATFDTDLTPGSERYTDILSWAGEPSQQAAVEILLKKASGGIDVTDRKSFGLPYGTEDIQGVSDEMVTYDFVAYVDPDTLWKADFAYMPAIDDLASLLHAESYRRADKGDFEGAISALMGSCKIYRQMCDRAYYNEVEWAFHRLSDRAADIRTFLWHFRDTITSDHCKTFCKELTRLNLDLIALPRAERIIGEQLVDQLYGSDNQPKTKEFASTMAAVQSQADPLARFEKAALWNFMVVQQAPKDEVRGKIVGLDNDWNRRWKLRPYDPQLATLRTVLEETDPTKFGLPIAVLGNYQELFELRFFLRTQVHGSIAASGLLAWQRRENGKMVEGERGTGAPERLAQVHPVFVSEEASLTDPYDINYGKIGYTIIRKRDKNLAWEPYVVELANRKVEVPEGWPFLYSVGPDRFDESGKHQLNIIGGDVVTASGDLIFWPPVELMK